jgi:DNA modification methylase
MALKLPAAMASRIEMWPLARLIPYERNARTHSKTQIEQIAASILEFGFTQPILVKSAGGILAGHGRLAAARLLGMEEVPVIPLDHLSEAQQRAYIIADNKLAENAGWDESLLRTELEQLQLDDFDMGVIGFTDREMKALLDDSGDAADGETDPDEAPALVTAATSRPGDLWLLGNHRLLVGDARDAEAIQVLMDGSFADLVFTDPPYNVDYEGKTARKLKIGNDKLADGFPEFLNQACANMLKFTRGAFYICMSSSELHTLQHAFTEAGGHWSTFVIWAKNQFTLGRSDYQRQYEPILYGWPEGSEHVWRGGRDQGDVWFLKRPHASLEHPTMKPVELTERALSNSTLRGNAVLDLFGGSGSTLIACERMGRHCRMMEIDPQYADVILKRWNRFTHHQPILAATGSPMLQVERERLPLKKEKAAAPVGATA